MTAFSEGRAYKWNTNNAQTKRPDQFRDQHGKLANTSKPKTLPSTVRGQNFPQRGLGKQKRSRNNRGSLEQDSKKRTVDTDSEHGHNASVDEHIPSS